jgi:hypothetical protein
VDVTPGRKNTPVLQVNVGSLLPVNVGAGPVDTPLLQVKPSEIVEESAA